MQIDVEQHIEETTLERYSMGSLAEEAAAEVEQHLLLCEACCTKATEADSYVRAMKRAAQELPAEPERFRWNLRLLLPAFAVCALLIAAAVEFSPLFDRSPTTIALFAMRGTGIQANGPSRRSLLLEPDLNGVPASPSYRVDLIGPSGSTVWQGVLSAQKQPPAALVPPQPRGLYFVRVSLPSGGVLREYKLELRGRD
jgi:hypothetical protein